MKSISSLRNQWKLTDLTVKSKITDSISKNLTDSDLESPEVGSSQLKYHD